MYINYVYSDMITDVLMDTISVTKGVLGCTYQYSVSPGTI